MQYACKSFDSERVDNCAEPNQESCQAECTPFVVSWEMRRRRKEAKLCVQVDRLPSNCAEARFVRRAFRRTCPRSCRNCHTERVSC